LKEVAAQKEDAVRREKNSKQCSPNLKKERSREVSDWNLEKFRRVISCKKKLHVLGGADAKKRHESAENTSGKNTSRKGRSSKGKTLQINKKRDDSLCAVGAEKEEPLDREEVGERLVWEKTGREVHRIRPRVVGEIRKAMKKSLNGVVENVLSEERVEMTVNLNKAESREEKTRGGG